MKKLALSLVLFPLSCMAAPCGPHSYTNPADVKLSAPAALLVTHPSTQWDGRFSSKIGVDAAVAFAKSRKFPVVYLEGVSGQDTYFFGDCEPTYWVASYGGEFSFEVAPNHIYSVGGHWELCQRLTQETLMQIWSTKTGVDLTFTEVLDGLYSYGAYVLESDPYRADFRRFIEVVSYRRPGPDWPKPKLNLLEMMGIIGDRNLQIAYLKRNLPSYSQLGPEYETQLWYNGQMVEVLAPARTMPKHIFKVEFVDSLYEGSGYGRGLRGL